MIFARKSQLLAALILNHRIRTVTTDVMVSSNLPIAIFYQEERVSCLRDLDIAANLWEPQLVRDKDPFLGKDSAALQLKHRRRRIPIRREGQHRLRLVP